MYTPAPPYLDFQGTIGDHFNGMDRQELAFWELLKHMILNGIWRESTTQKSCLTVLGSKSECIQKESEDSIERVWEQSEKNRKAGWKEPEITLERNLKSCLEEYKKLWKHPAQESQNSKLPSDI